MRHAFHTTMFILTAALFATTVTAADLPSYNPQNPPTLRDGLKFIDFKPIVIQRHNVNVGGITGTVSLEAFLPVDYQLPEDKSLPLAFGLDLWFNFDLKSKDKNCNLTYSLTVPKRARKWLRNYAKGGGFEGGLQQSIQGNTQTIGVKVGLNQLWGGWPRTVTNKAAAGVYTYSVALNGQAAVTGTYTLKALPRRDRDIFQRKATIYFFARHAFPHFAFWVKQKGGRMPTTKQFLDELGKLRYFPAHDYTAHRGMPKTFAQIRDPSKEWLAREMRPAIDGNVVVVYADGTIGLAGSDSFRRSRRR